MLTKLLANCAAINFKHEIMGGIINFIAISYIIIVNPIVLNAHGHGFPINATVSATILIIILATLLASVLVKLPFVLAPGMGINAFVSYTLIVKDHIAVPTILGMLMISSLLLLIFSTTKIRTIIIKSIPECLQIAIGSGIGVFLFFIGVKDAGLIVSNPDTMISLHKLALPQFLALAGFILAAILFIWHKIYALLLPIVILTVISLFIQHTPLSSLAVLQKPDFSLFMQMNVKEAMKLSLLPSILTLFIVNFFDATSTIVGFLKQDKFVENTNEHTLKNALLADSYAGIMSSIVGTSTAIIFIESMSGIASGARTGYASVVTVVLCLPFLFLSPLVELVPSFATAPVLMLVGLLMLLNIKKLHITAMEDLIVVAIIIIMMPLTFSITYGAAIGILTYTVLKLFLGKFNQVGIPLIFLTIICAGVLVL